MRSSCFIKSKLFQFELKHDQVNVKSLGLKTYDDEQNDYLVVNAFEKVRVSIEFEIFFIEKV